jgi:hypothetical protein
MKRLLKASAFEALKSVNDKTLDNTKQKKAIKEYIDNASLSAKVKFFIRSVKSKMFR